MSISAEHRATAEESHNHDGTTVWLLLLLLRVHSCWLTTHYHQGHPQHFHRRTYEIASVRFSVILLTVSKHWIKNYHTCYFIVHTSCKCCPLGGLLSNRGLHRYVPGSQINLTFCGISLGIIYFQFQIPLSVCFIARLNVKWTNFRQWC